MIGKSKSKEPENTAPGIVARLTTPFQVICTFSVVCVFFIFFRAISISDGLLILETILLSVFSPGFLSALIETVQSNHRISQALIIIGCLVLIEFVQRHRECPLEIPLLNLRAGWFRPQWLAYTALIWITLERLAQAGPEEFIYFAF